MQDSANGPPPSGLYNWVKTRLFGGWDDTRNTVFGPQTLSTRDMFGGGYPYARQMHVTSPNSIVSPNSIIPQSLPDFSILGNGNNPQGQWAVLPLIDVTTGNGTPSH